MTSPLPLVSESTSPAVAFKEWAIICQELGAGRQSVIIRKGGIAEGRDGFAFQHDRFCLFPTWFHEQVAKTTLPADTALPPEPGDELEISLAATLDAKWFVTDRAVLAALRPYHVWSEDAVEERYLYEGNAGVHVALVRIFRLTPPRLLQIEKKFGGCRSWVTLPGAEGAPLEPVLTDDRHAAVSAQLKAILGDEEVGS